MRLKEQASFALLSVVVAIFPDFPEEIGLFRNFPEIWYYGIPTLKALTVPCLPCSVSVKIMYGYNITI